MTKEMRTVEFVVLPTSRAKAKKMFQIAGACRYVWNHFREKNLACYQEFKNGKAERPQTSYFSLGVDFTKLRYETDWIHQTTKEIADKCGTVIVEDLKVKNMTASVRGTVENPGKNVKQKAGLNRAVLDTALGELRRNLEYKCGRLIDVNPAYTSQRCSECGHVDKENHKTQVRFQCVSCGFVSNADTNAAMNIRRLGMAQLHGEEHSVCKRTLMNREIDTRLTV